MSLHNSTIIENRNGLFYLVTELKSQSEALYIVSNYKSKAQWNGFWFERRNNEAKVIFANSKYGILQSWFRRGQAKKSARGMPWHQEPMKDVISCDKLRGAANKLRSGDFRMGKPTVRYRILNQIGIRGEPPELKHLSRARKRHQPRFRE